METTTRTRAKYKGKVLTVAIVAAIALAVFVPDIAVAVGTLLSGVGAGVAAIYMARKEMQ